MRRIQKPLGKRVVNLDLLLQGPGDGDDRTGRYLLADGQLSNRMTAYAIDKATGKLREYQTGKKPNWVEIVSFSR